MKIKEVPTMWDLFPGDKFSFSFFGRSPQLEAFLAAPPRQNRQGMALVGTVGHHVYQDAAMRWMAAHRTSPDLILLDPYPGNTRL